MNVARTIRDLRKHELSTTEADELARSIARAHEALKWYASADYGPNCKADVNVRARAVEALRGIE